MRICKALENEFKYLGHLITSFSFELSLLWPLLPIVGDESGLSLPKTSLSPSSDVCSDFTEARPAPLASQLGPHTWCSVGNRTPASLAVIDLQAWWLALYHS